MSWQTAVLLIYAVSQVALGLWIGRRVKSAGAFFVAGRQLGAGLLFTTLLAANIGAGSTVGAASLGYRHGLAAWWWVGSAAIGTFALAFTVGPKLWAIAKDHDLRTVGDYLELRYGATLRGLVAGLLWLGTLAILAGQLIALSWVLQVVAGVPKEIGCAIGGVVMIAYFVAGGLLTSAWVNLVQLGVLLAGFVVALPLAIAAGGGWGALRASPGVNWQAWQVERFLAGPEDGQGGWPLILLLAPAFLISPGLLQKIYGARDARAVRVGTFWCGVALLVFAGIPPLLGMVAKHLHPELGHADLALPTLLMVDLHPAIGLLGLAAVLSAEISTADALLFMLATSLSQDIYRRFVDPAASEAKVLAMARWAALAGGVLGVLLALLLPDVIAALRIFYSLLGICLFVPILGGLYWQRAGQREALAAVGLGIAVWLVCRFGGLPLPAHPLLAPDFLGLVASAVGFAVAAAFPASKPADRLEA